MADGGRRRGSAIWVTALTAALVASACGGGKAKEAKAGYDLRGLPPPTAQVSTIVPPATAPVGTALIRIANLYSVKDRPPSTIDLYQGFDAGSARPLVTDLAFGAATDYLPVSLPPARAVALTAYRHGATDAANRLNFLTPVLHPGDVLTLAVTSSIDLGGNTFYEVSAKPKPTLVAPGKALLVTSSLPVAAVFGEGDLRMWIGPPGGECLQLLRGERSVADEESSLSYTLDPGPVKIAVFAVGTSLPGQPPPAPDCRQAPEAAPVTLDAAPSSRVLVLPYGASRADLKLLVLPLRAASQGGP